MKKRMFAGFAALCMAASLASAAFAETATPETAHAEQPQVVEYSASDDATGFSAAAEAAPGVLPEGAKLTVVPLNETAEPEMASLLDGCAEPEAAGEYGERIAALDLAFKAQNQEVEPDGTVNVTIQLPGEIAAELQQAQELTLVHRVEQDGTTTPKKVESAVFADDCAKVSFETDSFSVYEIYATVPQDADGDITYTVTETAAEGYTTKKTGDTGEINAAEQTAEFTNNKAGSVDTGVVLNNMPYILVLAVLAAGVAVFIIRKRRED